MGNLNTSLHQTLVLTRLPSLTLVLPLRATMHGYALQAPSDSQQCCVETTGLSFLTWETRIKIKMS